MGPFAQGWTEADVEAVLVRGDPAELLYVPIVVGMNAPGCEQAWAERVCFELAGHPHFNVRGNALLGLGHIARTCRQLDLGRAVPMIAQALADPNDYVRGHANDAACDLHMYLGVLIPGYDASLTDVLIDTINDLMRQGDAG